MENELEQYALHLVETDCTGSFVDVVEICFYERL